MVTTMHYGSWGNVMFPSATVEDTVRAIFANEGTEDDVLAIADSYREEINRVLPPRVSLSGNEFYGPSIGAEPRFPGYPHHADGSLNLKEIIEENVDLDAVLDDYFAWKEDKF